MVGANSRLRDTHLAGGDRRQETTHTVSKVAEDLIKCLGISNAPRKKRGLRVIT